MTIDALPTALPTAPLAARPSRLAGRAWRLAALVLPALAGLAWALFSPRQGQSQAYHHFADGRTVAGIANGWNVLSNAGFALAGLTGLLALRRAPAARGQGRWSWVTFFGAVALTSLGSAWYHLAPCDERLVWDRLPMAVGFMSLLSALVGERIDRAAGRSLLAPLVLAGVASVGWWILTERAGAGSLKPYLFVQFYPLLAVPLVLILFPRPGARAWPYLVALAAYAAAKVFEVEDRAVFEAGHLVGGHALKHLLAAVGIGALAWAPTPIGAFVHDATRDGA